MPANILDKITATYNSANPNVARVNGTRVPSGTTLSCDNLAGWPTVSAVEFSTYKIDTNNAVIVGTQIDWKGLVSGNNIGSLTRVTGASDGGSAIGDVVEMNPTANWGNDLYTALTKEHKQLDGSHGAITADSAVITNLTATNITVGGQTPSPDWTALATPPNTVTYLGQRSYSLVFNGVDYTNILSPGQRLRTTRTVAAPTQCTSLNGTTQYWNKTSPNKLTFTDDFVVDAYVKLTSYPTGTGTIASRFDGTSGWAFRILSTGQLQIAGVNAGAGNYRGANSYQSIPLNKWVRVTAQLDMSAAAMGSTSTYFMIDGVDVPGSVNNGGSNPPSLIQAGNLQIGSENGTAYPFPGKIAQVAIYNAKVTQANIIPTHSQGLAGTETSLASAYSFNGVATDLNTTTPNDLTAQGSAGYTADSPFGTQASGLISSTLDYGIVQSAVFSTNTTVVVQVPEGCTIPTSGGVSAVSYSGLKAPYGFPTNKNRWIIGCQYRVQVSQGAAGAGTWYNIGSQQLSVPTGAWMLGYQTSPISNATTQSILNQSLSTANNTSGDMEFMTQGGAAITGLLYSPRNKQRYVILASTTPYYLNSAQQGGTGVTIYNLDNVVAVVPSIVEAENAYL